MTSVEDVNDLAPDPTTGKRDYRAYLQRVTSASTQVAGIVADRRSQLEQMRRIGPLVAAGQRFVEIEGPELGAVAALYVTIGLVPLMIIGFALVTDFSPTSSFGNLLVSSLHLHGESADLVRNTFTTSSNARAIATLFGIGSFVLVGLSLASTLRRAFARAWRIPYDRGLAAQVKGFAWFVLLIVMLSIEFVLERAFAGANGSLLRQFMVLPVGALVNFGFWWLTPRLLLDKPLGWMALLPSAVAGVGVALATRITTLTILPDWVGYYGEAFGGFGVVVAISFWIWLLAYGWVAIAAFGAVLWERNASLDRVLAVQLDDYLDDYADEHPGDDAEAPPGAASGATQGPTATP